MRRHFIYIERDTEKKNIIYCVDIILSIMIYLVIIDSLHF